jgi:hypothetical protein
VETTHNRNSNQLFIQQFFPKFFCSYLCSCFLSRIPFSIITEATKNLEVAGAFCFCVASVQVSSIRADKAIGLESSFSHPSAAERERKRQVLVRSPKSQVGFRTFISQILFFEPLRFVNSIALVCQQLKSC